MTGRCWVSVEGVCGTGTVLLLFCFWFYLGELGLSAWVAAAGWEGSGRVCSHARAGVGCWWVGGVITHRVAGWGMEMRRRGDGSTVAVCWLSLFLFLFWRDGILEIDGWNSHLASGSSVMTRIGVAAGESKDG